MQSFTHDDNDRQSAVNELIVFLYAGYPSHAVPTGDAMRIAVGVWMDALDAAGVPSAALRDCARRELATRVNNFPPSVADIARQWRLKQAEMPNKTIQQEDAERMNALPQGEDGPGRRAWIALGKRGYAVVCNCQGSPAAQLTPDSLHWACATRACDFLWDVSDTVNAPAPPRHGPLAATVGETATDAEKAAKAIRKVAGGNHSPFLQAFATDCNVHLDACTPQQYVEFRRFAHWFRDLYPGCKITPELLAEEYPKFQKEVA
jgi:hypothetical protein